MNNKYSFQDKMNSAEPEEIIVNTKESKNFNNMEKIDVLIVGAEGGTLTIQELMLEGKKFYTQKISETHFADNEEHTESISPLYHSFKQAMEYMKVDIFCLHPDYIDPEIWNELSDIYMNYCDGKSPDDFNSEGWDKALGIHDNSHVIDELVSLGLLKEQAYLLSDIMCQIKLDENTEKEIEALLNDPMAFEGGGPGVRETILLLAKEIQG